MAMGRSKRGFRYQQGWSPKWGKSEWTQVKVSVGIDLVEFILVGAVFYFYGEKPVASEVFEGSGDGSV